MATSFSAASRFLVVNGVPQADDVPPVSNLLESLAGLEAILTVFCAQGVYTTTRTHGNASLLLFWERHLRRLSNSARILANHLPDIFGALAPVVLSSIRPLVDESLQVGLGFALAERVRRAEVVEEFTELAVTVLICNGGVSGSSALDLYLHIGFYVPPVFGAAGARLALAGRGRDVAEAKYSQWARIRKDMERMRPPMVSELLLSNDGDRILEGSVTNFFVVCKVVGDKADDSTYDLEKAPSFVVQTAPLSDGVLPGVIRQLVIEVCSSIGIPLREVAPSWSSHELWKESFITSGLRLVQHVESIQIPTCKDFHLRSWNEVSWVTKRFEGVGLVTSQIQKEIIARTYAEGYLINNIPCM
ncbi:uncharacterized protein LOC110109581 isoform X1 [Dendrobium catenatum]|uniref:uncharacterized protein LOC110109581 isoform X1 n=1 Tax=Dendrobium catenatum TaxID=906689 RepID=UPI0010A08C6C|nr:uncharacterized protein LOC110109581 isoform X1 [Dendrobium catenatum]